MDKINDIIAISDSGEEAFYSSTPSSTRGSIRTSDGERWYPYVGDGERLTIFIAGNPGAGKSYLAKELIERMPDDVEILLFTALEENDGNFDGLGKRVHKVKMVPENLKRMSLKSIRDASKGRPILLLFDDVDKIRNKVVERGCFEILEDALANGRGHKHHDGEGDIHVIATSHALNDYRKTKYTLENSDYVAIFPQSTTYSQLKRLCDKLGVDKEMCDFIKGIGKRGEARSVIIRKTTPMYIMYADTITLF